jgi:hypothetical protein
MVARDRWRIAPGLKLEGNVGGNDTSMNQSAEHGPRTLTLLPWLDPGDGEVSFGRIKVARWSVVAHAVREPEQKRVSDLIGSYRTLRDGQIDPALAWFADRWPVAVVEESDRDAMRTHVFLLAVAGISVNTYWRHGRRLNASHFARVVQQFTVESDSIAIERRERDGSSMSGGWTPRELKFVEPIATMHRQPAEWPQAFLDSRGTCVERDDSLSTRVVQSAVPFLDAHTLNEYSTVEQDVVWLATALE